MNDRSAEEATTVLVADDQPAVLEPVVRLLENRGYRVLSASNGKDAVGEVRRARGVIKAAVLDVSMPHMEDARAVREIRELAPELLIILISGRDCRDTWLGAHADLNCRFLGKPFQIDALIDLMRDADEEQSEEQNEEEQDMT